LAPLEGRAKLSSESRAIVHKSIEKSPSKAPRSAATHKRAESVANSLSNDRSARLTAAAAPRSEEPINPLAGGFRWAKQHRSSRVRTAAPRFLPVRRIRLEGVIEDAYDPAVVYEKALRGRGFRKNVESGFTSHSVQRNRNTSAKQEIEMNDYQISSPRKAFAIASIALTALTIGLAVIVPAKMQPDAGDLRTASAVKPMSSPPVEVVRERLRIDVIGSREDAFAVVEVRTPAPKHGQEG
jgi:hypothetical protein